MFRIILSYLSVHGLTLVNKPHWGYTHKTGLRQPPTPLFVKALVAAIARGAVRHYQEAFGQVQHRHRVVWEYSA